MFKKIKKFIERRKEVEYVIVKTIKKDPKQELKELNKEIKKLTNDNKCIL